MIFIAIKNNNKKDIADKRLYEYSFQYCICNISVAHERVNISQFQSFFLATSPLCFYSEHTLKELPYSGTSSISSCALVFTAAPLSIYICVSPQATAHKGPA